ncbi:helix-turn-helix domain-containing protein [Umezawaea sp. Da 62-37]|uniref:helix-turn-helix domain-containing protein n=1 Tax=Umezawaea sp. Da 62-37 TaxID=3075927 RepID=UPI0037DC6AD0
MSSRTASTTTAHGSRRALPPPGLTVRYEAGASQRHLARSYHMSVRTVRALLVAAGVQIRPPGRNTRAESPAGTTTTTAERPRRTRAATPALATVHPLSVGDHEPRLAADPVIWPPADIGLPPLPPPLATATPGQPCFGFTTPHLIHTIDTRPVPTRAGQYTAAMTRCARVGLVDAPIPPDAQPCAACATTLAPTQSQTPAAEHGPEPPDLHRRQPPCPSIVKAP